MWTAEQAACMRALWCYWSGIQQQWRWTNRICWAVAHLENSCWRQWYTWKAAVAHLENSCCLAFCRLAHLQEWKRPPRPLTLLPLQLPMRSAALSPQSMPQERTLCCLLMLPSALCPAVTPACRRGGVSPCGSPIAPPTTNCNLRTFQLPPPLPTS